MDDNRRALHMKSDNEGSTISRDIKGKVNLKETPILEWSWKVVDPAQGRRLVQEGHGRPGRRRSTSCGRASRRRCARAIIGYVWDTTEPVGTIVQEREDAAP